MPLTNWRCIGPDFTRTMPIPLTSKWDRPKTSLAAQIAHMSELTRDLTETDKAMRSGPTGAIEFTVPMNSNDFVLVRLKSVRGSH
jgi:hypothetical protein